MESRKTNTTGKTWLDVRTERVSLSEHRNEWVAEVNGVVYINDSKATDPRAVGETLMEIERPVTLIMQISDTHEDYSSLIKLVKYKVTSLVVFGEGSEELLLNNLSVVADHFVRVNDLKQAVQSAHNGASQGSTVVFSPGCTSFSLFNDYRHRGDMFKAFVGAIFS
jgi:UDP-N-acetylmuramoylalanine--D-glutamate ligase